MQFWFQVSRLVRFWSLQVFQLLQLCLFVILSFLKPRTYVTHVWLIWHWVRLPVSCIVLGKMTHWQKDLIVTIGMHMDQNPTIVISMRQKSRNWNKEDKNHTIVILVNQNRTIETYKTKIAQSWKWKFLQEKKLNNNCLCQSLISPTCKPKGENSSFRFCPPTKKQTKEHISFCPLGSSRRPFGP